MADTAAVRQWAREQGYPVGDRGRLSPDLVRAYEAATGAQSGAAPAGPPARRPAAGRGAGGRGTGQRSADLEPQSSARAASGVKAGRAKTGTSGRAKTGAAGGPDTTGPAKPGTAAGTGRTVRARTPWDWPRRAR